MSSHKPTSCLALYHDYARQAGSRLELFRAVAERFEVRRALYAGSWVHVTPSLVIPEVVYVDSDCRTPKFFADGSVHSYVHRNREYSAPATIRFHFQDYTKPLDETPASFDLLISQYAGFVSTACKRYLRRGGYLLANDSHGDASMAKLDPDFALVAAVTRANKVRERERGRGIPYTYTAPHYLFRKLS